MRLTHRSGRFLSFPIIPFRHIRTRHTLIYVIYISGAHVVVIPCSVLSNWPLPIAFVHGESGCSTTDSKQDPQNKNIEHPSKTPSSTFPIEAGDLPRQFLLADRKENDLCRKQVNDLINVMMGLMLKALFRAKAITKILQRMAIKLLLLPMPREILKV